jgi:hypothetical protein
MFGTVQASLNMHFSSIETKGLGNNCANVDC